MKKETIFILLIIFLSHLIIADVFSSGNPGGDNIATGNVGTIKTVFTGDIIKETIDEETPPTTTGGGGGTAKKNL